MKIIGKGLIVVIDVATEIRDHQDGGVLIPKYKSWNGFGVQQQKTIWNSDYGSPEALL